MNHKQLKQMCAALRVSNSHQTVTLSEIPRDTWPQHLADSRRVRVLRSKTHLVQIYEEANGVLRMSVNRSAFLSNGRWDDGLTWDELQELKRQAGYEARWAVEVYPPDKEIVNVANMRHLWLLVDPPPFAWCEKAA